MTRPDRKRKPAPSSKKRAVQPRKPAARQPIPQAAPKIEISASANGAPQAFHQSSPAPARRTLPSGYGDNQIYLLVRDPYWIYSYWEIRGEVQADALRRLGGDWAHVTSILRVFDLTESDSSFFDIRLQGMVSDWYVEVRPNRRYVIEIGLLHRDGRFIALARSNEVTTPRDSMSDILDEEWMCLDFDKMYALSGGFAVGLSSQDLKKRMSERRSVSSGSGGFASSPTSPFRVSDRGFRFHLDCELVVYGSTEPDAKVTVQGQRVELRPDGTFTLRYALPDGKIALDARAQSADGREERAIVPIVERTTGRPDPRYREADAVPGILPRPSAASPA